MKNIKHSYETLILHNKHKVEPNTGAVSVPIYHSSTFHQNDFETFGEYEYSRGGNPTRLALEDTIAHLEGGARGFAFSSGMAAISTAFMLLSKGDHVLITEDVYGGTYRLITQILNRFGIDHTFVDMTDLDKVKANIKSNTKVIYLETPSNPLLKITDIAAVQDIAEKHGCLTFLDNTFMTPLLQRPIELGVDVVLHSATKFLGGHSDVIAGLAVTKDKTLSKELKVLQNAFGSILGVQDSWLILRGIKTLSVRLKESSKSAEKIATFLDKHPKVGKVFYPGFESHPGHIVHKKQAKGFGAVLSFELENKAAAKIFVENISIPAFAVSLGGVETILSYPATMSHGSMPSQERFKRGISDGLLRLSVGLEHPDDLIADISQALDVIS